MTKKKIVKPTEYEQAQIDKRLAKTHSHMLKESWTKRLKKDVRKLLKKRRASKTYQLARSGLTKQEIKRMGVK